MSTPNILVVEDDATLREAICDTLALAGYDAIPAADGVAALDVLAQRDVALIIADVKMPRLDGYALLNRVKTDAPRLPVLLMTAFGTIQNAVAAMRDGAADYLVKPFEASTLTDRVAQLLPPATGANDDGVVAVDARSRDTLALARRVAATDATVMIAGESGTGKEVLAQYIHRHSRRRQQPFVAINCAAIPDNMLEAVLFGYEKGAFTGAHQTMPGKFEQANGGTLLLDEISEMPLTLQAKLLRVLQEREVERLGGRKTIALDVRVLATSNRVMREEVAAGRFREDLYFRLNVFPVYVAALRERTDDIVPLARSLIAHHARAEGRGVPDLSAAAQAALRAHAWPGNVRELGNVIQRALILQRGDIIDASDLPLEAPHAAHTPPAAESVAFAAMNDLKQHEQQLILDTIKSAGSRKVAAARLGISARTLRYKVARMRAAGIAVPGRDAALDLGDDV